jgi:chromosome partitioning protein
MYTVSFANPKGGSGKTTSALIFAEQLARAGAKVGILDCDPNQNIVHWEKERTDHNKNKIFDVIGITDEEEFMDKMAELENQYDYLVVDLEGTASQLVTYATSQSDLVLIPFEPTPMETRQAARAIKLVRSTSRMVSRDIKHSLLITRANAAFQTSDEKDVRSETTENNIPVLKTALVRRAAFTRIFREGALLGDLLEDAKKQSKNSSAAQQDRIVSPIRKAISNAKAFTQEVVNIVSEMEDAA